MITMFIGMLTKFRIGQVVYGIHLISSSKDVREWDLYRVNGSPELHTKEVVVRSNGNCTKESYYVEGLDEMIDSEMLFEHLDDALEKCAELNSSKNRWLMEHVKHLIRTKQKFSYDKLFIKPFRYDCKERFHHRTLSDLLENIESLEVFEPQSIKNISTNGNIVVEIVFEDGQYFDGVLVFEEISGKNYPVGIHHLDTRIEFTSDCTYQICLNNTIFMSWEDEN